jgi:hypothetical protein
VSILYHHGGLTKRSTSGRLSIPSAKFISIVKSKTAIEEGLI